MKKLILLICLTLIIATTSVFSAGNDIKSGSTIAFIRNGGIWLMESDGSNQRSFVLKIDNARGKMSWSPDNSKLVFSRYGEINMRYPSGGGGAHKLNDLFYAYADSTNDWWEGITSTLGCIEPEYVGDGKRIMFTHDLNKNTVNAPYPKKRICFYDTKIFLLRNLDMPSSSDLIVFSPSASPDVSQVAFMVMQLQGEQYTPAGMAIANVKDFPMQDDVLLANAKLIRNVTGPAWSPDGNWISYISTNSNDQGIFIVSPDRKTKRKVYQPDANIRISAIAPSWSPDSKYLAFSTINGSIYKVNIDDGKAIRLSGPGNDSYPAWSN